ncbi:HicB family protein [Halobacteriovorax marinus]|uniref:HicB family protein n=1 Tax=Halobacteriovorax marinus TaxID=97084 RepID=A0A1Y5F9Z9_9BACT|nr:HicB family protein [Halobacteriovorax marinus]
MKYHFEIHKEKKGYWAECIELEGCSTQADSRDELLENMKEALNLYLDEPEDSKIDFPLPKKRVKKVEQIVTVAVNSKVAFALLLRHARHEKKLSQTKMAKLLNYKSVFSYQKLESSKSANPTLLKVQRLKEVLPNLRLDLLFS